MNWLENQDKKVVGLYWGLGICYFCFNVWYFLVRLHEMGCGISVGWL